MIILLIYVYQIFQVSYRLLVLLVWKVSDRNITEIIFIAHLHHHLFISLSQITAASVLDIVTMRYELTTGYSLIQTQSLRGRPGGKKWSVYKFLSSVNIDFRPRAHLKIEIYVESSQIIFEKINVSKNISTSKIVPLDDIRESTAGAGPRLL